MSTLISACSSTGEVSEAVANALPRLHLMALGGPMRNLARAERGLAQLQALGFEVDNLSVLTRQHSRFAGTDQERAYDLNQLLEPGRRMPDMILATRGGYGSVRLLDRLAYAELCPKLRQHGTVLMGYSDNTAVQLALYAKGQVVSFSGPMLYGDFAADPCSAFTLGWLKKVVCAPSFTLQVNQAQRQTASCQGTLWGGNLTVLTSLVGTPYLPDVPGGILFIEDVGENVYQVERMLQQLRLAGILGRQSAVLLGHFSKQQPDGYDPDGYTVAHLAQALSGDLGIPFLMGLPVGHVHDIVPMPIGAHAQLSATPDGFILQVSGYPVLKQVPSAFKGSQITTVLE